MSPDQQRQINIIAAVALGLAAVIALWGILEALTAPRPSPENIQYHQSRIFGPLQPQFSPWDNFRSTIRLASDRDETVYLSGSGSTYHRTKTCMALRRAKPLYHATLAEAEAHGLTPCKICYRKSNPTNGWAKEEK